MTEAMRYREIVQVKLESLRRAEMQLGDDPNIYAYMDSYATLMLTHATSLVALELNRLNLFLCNRESSDPFDSKA